MSAGKRPKYPGMKGGFVQYAQSDKLVTRKIAGETILVPIECSAGDLNAIFTLNPTGTRIWDMLGKCASDRSIIQSICSEYEVACEEAEKDLEEFQRSLRDAGLIVPSPKK
jgi:hypothetical protein